MCFKFFSKIRLKSRIFVENMCRNFERVGNIETREIQKIRERDQDLIDTVIESCHTRGLKVFRNDSRKYVSKL